MNNPVSSDDLDMQDIRGGQYGFMTLVPVKATGFDVDCRWPRDPKGLA